MNKLVNYLVFAFFMCAALLVNAEQKFVKGDWDIHYIAFPATFVEPDVAKNYQLIRSKYKGIVNISVLDNQQNMKAQNAYVSGTAKNLLGQRQELTFKKVEEGNAIYFLAQFDYNDQEAFNFSVDVQRGDRTETIKFSKTFYVD
ncbi:MAG: DUF4426 domain-containing protein [Gammaproteobacteria bacterium]|nr:DUF4426 domain-containing protein [Gammaproteobacteria bacterium]